MAPFDIGIERSTELCVTKISTHNFAIADGITKNILGAYKSLSGKAQVKTECNTNGTIRSEF